MFCSAFRRRAALLLVWAFAGGAGVDALAGADAAGAERIEGPYHVYLNVDLTHTAAIGESLRQGFVAGLAAGEVRFGGPEVQMHVRDHRNNIRRTERLIDEAASDPATIAVLGGMQSPHYLRHGATFNARGLVLLLPWSAGAALTRLANGPDNYIFRLSVDDSKAAPFLAQEASRHRCTRVATLTLDNGWGRGNSEALRTQLPARGLTVVHQGLVRQDAGEETINGALSAMALRRPNCVILVLNVGATAVAANGFAQWEAVPDILSHWGILGGGFADHTVPDVWSRLNIALLSTCVFDPTANGPGATTDALDSTADRWPGAADLDGIPSLTAFAHAHDLGLILRAALPQAQRDPRWRAGRAARGAALRDALEDLDEPVDGLLKRYLRPFSASGVDRHEALGQADLCLAQLSSDGRLTPRNWGAAP